jgi:hypothetical protein
MAPKPAPPVTPPAPKAPPAVTGGEAGAPNPFHAPDHPFNGATDLASGTLTPEPFSWGDMPAPVLMPTRPPVTVHAVDVISEIPEPIRMRAESSLARNTLALAKSAGSQAKRPRIDYVWSVQQVASAEMGAEFVKLITRYCKYRPSGKPIPHADADSKPGQVTVRCGEVTQYRKAADGTLIACAPDADGAFTGVRYSVRPYEQRGTTARLPGTT